MGVAFLIEYCDIEFSDDFIELCLCRKETTRRERRQTTDDEIGSFIFMSQKTN